MINGELKKKAKLSFHMECVRLKGDTDKNIYTNGYINGYREAMADLKNILDLSHNNFEKLYRIDELLKEVGIPAF